MIYLYVLFAIANKTYILDNGNSNNIRDGNGVTETAKWGQRLV